MLASVLKIIASAALLAVASYQDIRTREIDDRIWIFLGVFGGTLTAYELYEMHSLQLIALSTISAFIAVAFGFLTYRGGMLGGADAKAIFCLGVMFPYRPELGFRPIYPYHPLFTISILENTFLLSLLTLLYFVSRNVALLLRGEKLFGRETPFLRKIILFLTSTKYDVLETDWSKIFPVEYVDYSLEKPEVKYSFFSNVNVDVNVGDLVRGFKEGFLDREIWGTYGLPTIVFIAIGVYVSIFLGDIVLAFLSFLTGFP